MKSLLFILLLIIPAGLNAQYYYKDILGTRESNDLMRNYKAQGVERVTLNAFNADGSPVDGFYGSQLVEGNKLHTLAGGTGIEGSRMVAEFDDEGRIIRTSDTSGSRISESLYSWYDNERLASVLTRSVDSSMKLDETEIHYWYYGVTGNPEKMVRVRNKDSVTFYLTIDDNGLPLSEFTMGESDPFSDKVHYYYNEDGWLTDIVRYHRKAKRLLPEAMFEYDNDGRVIQKITVPADGAEYTIWRYQYNNEGLKLREAAFDRRRQLTGRIEYLYQKRD